MKLFIIQILKNIIFLNSKKKKRKWKEIRLKSNKWKMCFCFWIHEYTKNTTIHYQDITKLKIMHEAKTFKCKEHCWQAYLKKKKLSLLFLFSSTTKTKQLTNKLVLKSWMKFQEKTKTDNDSYLVIEIC